MSEFENESARWSEPGFQKERDAAVSTLYLLADQVGVKCADCGLVLHGHDQIRAVTYMSPVGMNDYQARPYCEGCAEAYRSDE